MEDDAQAVLTALREDGRAVPTHVLRNRLDWGPERFMPAVAELVQGQRIVQAGGMLALPVTTFAMPTLPDEAREEETDQEPVMGPDLPLPGAPDPAPQGRRFLVATEWEEHDGTPEEIAETLLHEQVGVEHSLLLVAEDDALIFERAVIARRVS